MACDPCISYCKCHGSYSGCSSSGFFRVIIIGLGLGSVIHLLVWPCPCGATFYYRSRGINSVPIALSSGNRAYSTPRSPHPNGHTAAHDCQWNRRLVLDVWHLVVSCWITWRGPRWDTRWNGLPHMIVVQSCAGTHSALYPDGGPPSWPRSMPLSRVTRFRYRYGKIAWPGRLIIQVRDTAPVVCISVFYSFVLPRLSVLTVTLTVSDHPRESRYQLYCRVY